MHDGTLAIRNKSYTLGWWLEDSPRKLEKKQCAISCSLEHNREFLLMRRKEEKSGRN
jgi:hypothetical protein